jgi:hypothetical protein
VPDCRLSGVQKFEEIDIENKPQLEVYDHENEGKVYELVIQKEILKFLCLPLISYISFNK